MPNPRRTISKLNASPKEDKVGKSVAAPGKPRVDMGEMTVRKARALALLRSGRTWREVKAETGLSNDTLDRLSKGNHTINESMISALMAEETMKLTMISHRMMDSINSASDEDLAKIPVNQRMVTAAISLDKRELLAGRPTARVEMSMKDDALEAEIARLVSVVEAAGMSVYEDAEDAEYTVVGDTDEKDPQPEG
jgi:hypothetical protein